MDDGLTVPLQNGQSLSSTNLKVVAVALLLFFMCMGVILIVALETDKKSGKVRSIGDEDYEPAYGKTQSDRQSVNSTQETFAYSDFGNDDAENNNINLDRDSRPNKKCENPYVLMKN
jgi:hypothetical protein